MKPVDQDRFGGDGNCWQACVASLLELPLHDLPPQGPRYGKTLGDFLATRGLKYCEVCRGSLVRQKSDLPPMAEMVLGWQPFWYGPRLLCVLCGPSPRHAGMDHCVVGYLDGLGFEVLHDPHPDRTGVVDVTHVGLLVSLNVAQLILR